MGPYSYSARRFRVSSTGSPSRQPPAAATMGVEPTEDQIEQVIEFANLDPQNDRGLAIQALKVCGHLEEP